MSRPTAIQALAASRHTNGFFVESTPAERMKWTAIRYGHRRALEEFQVGSQEGFDAVGRYALEEFERLQAAAPPPTPETTTMKDLHQEAAELIRLIDAREARQGELLHSEVVARTLARLYVQTSVTIPAAQVPASPVEARDPVHQPGMFNVDIHNGRRWCGGRNRVSADAAIRYARDICAVDGHRTRVVDPEGRVIFDTAACYQRKPDAERLDDYRCANCGKGNAAHGAAGQCLTARESWARWAEELAQAPAKMSLTEWARKFGGDPYTPEYQREALENLQRDRIVGVTFMARREPIPPMTVMESTPGRGSSMRALFDRGSWL